MQRSKPELRAALQDVNASAILRLGWITVDYKWNTSIWCWTRTLFMYDLHNKLAFGRRGVSEERLYTQSG